jgi:hypothetical protein
MARSDTRYSIYPAPKAVEILGSTSPALNQAIECWAALLSRAMGDNNKTFWNVESTHVTGREEHMYALLEWSVLAKALKNKRFDPDFGNPGDLLATSVEDAHRVENLAYDYFSMDLPPEEYSSLKLLEELVGKLVKKLRNLDYAHAWAVILAVQWFWEHHDEGIDIEKDEWWRLTFRRQWNEKHFGNKRGTPTSDQQNTRKLRKKNKRSTQ